MRTRRLVLRPFVVDDLPDLIRFHTDPKVQTGYHPQGQAWSIEEITDRLKSYIAAMEEHGFSRWKMTLDSGEFVGRASLWWYEPGEAVEIGYGLLPEYWGRGYAREVSTALVNWGFEHLPIKKIVGFTFVDNLRSRKILTALGMTYVEDRVRSAKDGVCAFYEITRTQAAVAQA